MPALTPAPLSDRASSSPLGSGHGPIKARRLILAGLCVLAAWLVCASGNASAALVNPLVGSFGSFSTVQGVAVDQSSGDVYVLDAGAGAVFKYDASGAPVNFSGSATNEIEGVGGAGSGESEIAVDNSSGPDAGDIYVADNSGVEIYSAAGAKLGEITGGEACGVAVDPVGNVYVGFYPSTVRKYAPSSNPVGNANETTSMGGLNGICNVAVDAEGNLYAATYSGGVSKYAALQFGSQLASGTVVDAHGSTLAVDPSTNAVYIDEGSEIVGYDSSGNLIGNAGSGVLNGSNGVGVEHGGGRLYAADGGGHVDIFGTPVVVPDVTTQPASSVKKTTATLNGSVNPDGTSVSACKFEYGTEAGVYGHTVACAQTLPLTGSSPVAVSAAVSGLELGSSYHYRLVATNANGTNVGQDETLTTATAVDGLSTGPAVEVSDTAAKLTGSLEPDGNDTHYYFEYGPESSYGSTSPAAPGADAGSATELVSAATSLSGLTPNTTYHYRLVGVNSLGTSDGEDRTFTTQGPPVVASESLANLSTTSVTLRAQVNPDGVGATAYFQYGTANCTTSPASCTEVPVAPGTDLGAGHVPVPLVAALTNLTPETTYHYRVVASSALGSIAGADQVFTTSIPASVGPLPSAGPEGLPDGRGYELVSPPEKDFNDLATVYGYSAVSPEGDRATFISGGAFGDATGSPATVQYLATRVGRDRWQTHSITPPQAVVRDNLLRNYTSNPTLSESVVESTALFTPGASSSGNVYLQNNETGERSLIAAAPSSSFGFAALAPANIVGTSDYSHIAIQLSQSAAGQYTPEDPAPPAGSMENLYDYTGGHLHLVTVYPSGVASPTGGVLAGTVEGDLFSNAIERKAISSDGSRIFFNAAAEGAPEGSPKQLYVREDDSRTVMVSRPDPGVTDPEGPQVAHFGTASADGSIVYFTSTEKLTADSQASNATNSADLYRYDVASDRLTDLTAFDTNGAKVTHVIGASADGAYVYFGAEAELAPGASPGAPNIYVSHDGGIRFVAHALTTGAGSSVRPAEGAPAAPAGGDNRVTADGLHMVFESDLRTTSYDNDGYPEYYIYDYDSNELRCATCNPTGQKATHGTFMAGFHFGGSYPLRGNYEEIHDLSADGSRFFFVSSEKLVRQDTNGLPDVYEWENGTVYLISTGTSSSETILGNVSANGNDVTFLTRQSLSSADDDTAVDVYDAAVGGGPEPSVAPPACTGTGCQGVPAAPPIFATPASETFSGVGNFAAPAKKAVKSKKPKKKVTKKKKAKTKKAKTKKASSRGKRKPAKPRQKSTAKKSTARRGGRQGENSNAR
jgi:hypothetical protein